MSIRGGGVHLSVVEDDPINDASAKAGYFVFALRHPAPWEEDERGEWSRDHLVHYHGWSSDEVSAGKRIDAERVDAASLAIDNRHADEHYERRELPVPHVHGDKEAVDAVINATSWGPRLKAALYALVETADPREKGEA